MNKGISYAILTTFISGFSIFASKFFITDIDPILFTTLKNTIAAVVLSSVVYFGYKKSLGTLTRAQWLALLIIGIIGGGIPFALFFKGLSMITALEGALIHKTLFIWVAIMSVLFLREKISRFQIMGYIVVTIGVGLAGGVFYNTFGLGHLMIFLATLFWSVEYIIAKKTLEKISPILVAWARMFFGVIILLGISIFQGSLSQTSKLDSRQFISIFSGAIFLLGYVLTWYRALADSQASAVSLVLSASPIITGIFSSIFISHIFPQATFLSWFLTASGIVLVLCFDRSNRILKI